MGRDWDCLLRDIVFATAARILETTGKSRYESVVESALTAANISEALW